MFTDHGAAAKTLDMTPGSLGGVQDWDFNAFAGPGNFEWDITPGPFGLPTNPGILAGGAPGVFGFAMPGNWFDAVNSGWAHSWGAY
jgi:hypothetical protein